MYNLCRRLLSTRETWAQKPFKPRRAFCSTNTHPSPKPEAGTYEDTLKKLQNMDMRTAAEILFSEPQRKRKFGLDFHLVQLFFTCMPSLAVYLIAQYARSEMRIVEAELEEQKRIEQEKKDAAAYFLVDMKERLVQLEESVKEIVNDSKKQTADCQAKSDKGEVEKKNSGPVASKLSSSESSKPVGINPLDKQDSAQPRPAVGKDRVTESPQVPNASQDDKR